MDSVDFLPERIHAQRQRRRGLLRQGYLLVICAAGLVALGYYRQGRIAEVSAQVTLLEGSSRNLQDQSARRTDLEEQLKDLDIKKRVEDQLGSRTSAQLVLAELQHQLPPTVSLTRLELETSDFSPGGGDGDGHYVSARAAVAGAANKPRPDAVKRVRLTITGLAPTDVDVANFIGQLAVSPLFEDVNMGYARNITVSGHLAREFKASCYVAR